MKKARIITKARNAGIASISTALASVIPPLNYDAMGSIQLHHTLLSMTLIFPPHWMITSANPLAICKIAVYSVKCGIEVAVSFSFILCFILMQVVTSLLEQVINNPHPLYFLQL